MKLIMSTFLLLSLNSFANTHSLEAGKVYMGRETLNEKATGNACYITIKATAQLSTKGLHCHQAAFQFDSQRADLPESELVVQSRITNYQREEYPEVKSCAVNVNGSVLGNEIYEEDTTVLYNQIFGGSFRSGLTRYDYFLTFEPVYKEAVRARIHVQGLFSEYDVDCIDLSVM